MSMNETKKSGVAILVKVVTFSNSGAGQLCVA
jgi:hypothetical protein